MRIEPNEHHALRLALRLAQAGGQRSLPQLAADEGLSLALTAKVLGRLRRGGLVRATRGRRGGYTLTRPASRITLAAVLRALGRPLVTGGCLPAGYRRELCPRRTGCALRRVWQELARQHAALLSAITLAELSATARPPTARRPA